MDGSIQENKERTGKLKTAIILCAGKANRMRSFPENLPKQLIKVGGRQILERTLILLKNQGIERFIIVVNEENSAPIEEKLTGMGIDYHLILNKEPERENGYSLFLATESLEDEGFILTMGDHLYSEDFIAQAVRKKGLVLDRLGLFIDRNEATKVLCKEGKVSEIGKDLDRFDGFDTGFFILSKDIHKTAERLVAEKEKVTLSEIVRDASIPCSEVSGEFWTDVDTPEDIVRARKGILLSSVKGDGDGWISRNLNRKVSLWVSEKLIEKVSPFQATFGVFIIGVLSALTALFNPPLGGILYQISSMLDGVDGEIARAGLRTSRLGGWLDSVLDRVVDFLFLSALALWINPQKGMLLWILLAVFGSLMVSYTTERYRGAFGEDAHKAIRELRYIPGKRDERIFFIMIMSIIGWIELMFIVLAIITNLRVLLTTLLIWFRHQKG